MKIINYVIILLNVLKVSRGNLIYFSTPYEIIFKHKLYTFQTLPSYQDTKNKSTIDCKYLFEASQLLLQYIVEVHVSRIFRRVASYGQSKDGT